MSSRMLHNPTLPLHVVGVHSKGMVGCNRQCGARGGREAELPGDGGVCFAIWPPSRIVYGLVA